MKLEMSCTVRHYVRSWQIGSQIVNVTFYILIIHLQPEDAIINFKNLLAIFRFFGVETDNCWHNLPYDIVNATFQSVFNNKLDKFWKDFLHTHSS